MGGEPQTLQGIREAAEEAGAHLEHAPDLPRATRLLAAGAWTRGGWHRIMGSGAEREARARGFGSAVRAMARRPESRTAVASGRRDTQAGNPLPQG